MEHELGSITPSRCADMIMFDDLNEIHVTRTIIDGEVVAENGKFIADLEPAAFPSNVFNTMHVGKKITPDEFIIKAPAEKVNNGKITTRIIESVQNKVWTNEIFAELDVNDGIVSAPKDSEILKMAVFERHHETGSSGLGFVTGFGKLKGAMAQTISHDAHNLLVAGTDDNDMALAANTLIECGGGLCAVLDGKVLAVLPLPIAGLMSDKPVEDVAEQLKKIGEAWKELGCEINSPYMTMALVPLACIPAVRLTNRGLVDCRTYQFTDLFI